MTQPYFTEEVFTLRRELAQAPSDRKEAFRQLDRAQALLLRAEFEAMRLKGALARRPRKPMLPSRHDAG